MIRRLTITHALNQGLNRFALLCLSLMLVWNQQVSAQETVIEVKGKIIAEDSSGTPVAGASVMIAGMTRGTSTDVHGEFVLKNVPEGAQIIISAVGFDELELSAKRVREGHPIILFRSGGSLDDVVITGFQRIDKNKFGGAAASVKMDQIKSEGVTDISRMLEGRVAGVSIQNPSGTFGSAPKIRIRGATSLNGANKPLWVVDGVVLEDVVNITNDQLTSGDPTTLLGSPVAGLNPNDIESFDILKDAAAAALYGARAMNGVVVITTKRGKIGKPVVNYSLNLSTQLKPSYNNFNIMNSAEQMSILAQLERKGAFNAEMTSKANYAMFGKMYDLLNANDAGQFALENTPEARRAFLMRYANANTDWFDVLFRNSMIQEHSISTQFGTERSQSYFSVSYLNDNGWTIADKVKRITVNGRNDFKLSDKISGGLSVLGSSRIQRAPGTVGRRSNAVSGTFDRDFDINPFSYAINTSRAVTAYNENGNLEYFTRNFAPFNIIDELRNNYIDITQLDLKLQAELSYKITNFLRYDFLGSGRMAKTSTEHQITENSNMANAYRAAKNSTIRANNNFLYLDPDNPEAEKQIVLPRGGFYNRKEDDLSFYNIRNSLNFSNTFNTRHYVNALVGQEIKMTNRKAFSNTGYGYQYENGGVPFVDYRILKQAIEANLFPYSMGQDWERFVGYYLTAQYSLDDKYNISAYGRYDGTNRFGKSGLNRWIPTWSIAGAWNFNREGFAKDWRWLDFGKLYGSYGLSGDMGPATNASVLYKNYVTRRPWLDEKESAIYIASLANIELDWEKMHSSNIGLSMGFLKGAFSFTVDRFSRKSFDLIDRIATSGIGGQYYKFANYADISSKGWDIALNARLLKTQDWDASVMLNLGISKTNVTRLDNLPLIFDLVNSNGENLVGRPVKSLFSIQFDGLSEVDGTPYFINEEGNRAHEVYFQSDKIGHLKYEGPVDAPYTSGFSSVIKYKGLSLNFLVSAQWGNKIRLNPLFNNVFSDWAAFSKDYLDAWLVGGDENVTNIPSISDLLYQNKLSGQYTYSVYNLSTERVAKGDFIRLKSVSLNYMLRQNQLGSFGRVFQAASVGLSAINPWLIYSDKKLRGQDPEFFNTGGVAQPIQKQLVLSVRATF